MVRRALIPQAGSVSGTFLMCLCAEVGVRTAPCRIKIASHKKRNTSNLMHLLQAIHMLGCFVLTVLRQGVEPKSGVTEQASQAVKAGEMMGLSGWVANDSCNVEFMLPLVQKPAPGT